LLLSFSTLLRIGASKLYIYDSLSKQKNLFVPIKPNEVSIYVCGVTVYDHCHIGHARTFIIFDMMVRFLRSIGYKVTYVRNITDIDDKIIQRAEQNGESWQNLTERMIVDMHSDFSALGLQEPDHEPKATQHIRDITSLIETLVDKGYAYVSNDGDVFFSVEKYSNYGCLSGQDLAELKSGSRVDINHAKQSSLDFALWKSAKPGEPSWDSPWGQGRPGWHIECSAMSMAYLGETFDLHGGGHDLKFPHHENECAQSIAATGGEYAKAWLHVGFLQVNSEKMAKSAGNFVTIRQALSKMHPDVLRLLVLQSHYRSPVEYTDANITSATNSVKRMYTCLRGLSLDGTKKPENTTFEADFIAAMKNDFNTPLAITVLFEIVTSINTLKEQDKLQAANLAKLLQELAGCIGLLTYPVEDFFQHGIDAAAITKLVADRDYARASKDWSTADKIRDELLALGIIVEDGVGGSSWRRE